MTEQPTTSSSTSPALPFEVAATPYSVALMCGKWIDPRTWQPTKPEGHDLIPTVLVLDQQLFNFTIKEYYEPLYYGRAWDYESLAAAIQALAHYLETDALEPDGWVRALDKDGLGHAPGTPRVRRRAPDGSIFVDKHQF